MKIIVFILIFGLMSVSFFDINEQRSYQVSQIIKNIERQTEQIEERIIKIEQSRMDTIIIKKRSFIRIIKDKLNGNTNPQENIQERTDTGKIDRKIDQSRDSGTSLEK